MKDNKTLYAHTKKAGSGEAIIVKSDYFMKGIDYLLGEIDNDAKKQQTLIENAEELTITEKMDLMTQIQLRRTVLGITVITVPYILYKALL